MVTEYHIKCKINGTEHIFRGTIDHYEVFNFKDTMLQCISKFMAMELIKQLYPLLEPKYKL
jgi:hypothetical protein